MKLTFQTVCSCTSISEPRIESLNRQKLHFLKSSDAAQQVNNDEPEECLNIESEEQNATLPKLGQLNLSDYV